jgi:transcriptional regulator with XRE-family HTH domain
MKKIFLLKQSRLKQGDLAKKLGISESYLSLILNKKRIPPLMLALKMKKMGINLWGIK